ncbi:hypothetical protein HD554DRAFT_2012229, partial [Boletus coccyginus]
YPTLTHIAKDICVIPTTSIPCEWLFFTGAEIATDCYSHLGADKFEYLQVLKHHWQHTLQDSAAINASYAKKVNLAEYKDLLAHEMERSNGTIQGSIQLCS